MAERRMFSKTIIDSDEFLDMPLSTQSLYFHLAMRADDEGFVNNPKKICRMIGSGQDELKILIGKRFLLTFESGVVVIKHWLIHNMIRRDRMKETLYLEEKKQITIKENNSYTEVGEPIAIPMVADGQPIDNQMSAQVRLDKVRLGEVSLDKGSAKKPTQKQVFSDIIFNYTQSLSLIEAIETFVDMRKSIKAKLTEHALKLLLTKLDKMATNDETKIEILNQSTMNSWKGIFEVKGNNNNQSNFNDEFKQNMESGPLADFLREE
jgi:hypothetical protein